MSPTPHADHFRRRFAHDAGAGAIRAATAALLTLLGCGDPVRDAPPPATGLARATLHAPGARWDSLTDGRLTVYAQPDTWAALHHDEMRLRSARALDHALSLLGESSYPGHVRVFLLESPAHMALVTGQRHNGTADAASHAVLVVANRDWSPFDRHEIMHAASLNLWGEPGAARRGSTAWRREGWLREGIAALAEDRCGRWTGRGVAAAMHAAGEGTSLDELTGSFYALDDLRAYLQAGSLVEYLLEIGGRDALRQLWRSGTAGLERVYGRDPAAIDVAWRAWLATTPAAERPPDLEAMREAGCGAGEPPRR